MQQDDSTVSLQYAAAPRKRWGGWLGPWFTSILLAAIFVPFAMLCFGKDGPSLFVLSGRLFASQFSTVHVGSALDQPTIGKWYFLFTFFAGASLPYLALVRWLSDRRQPLTYWIYAFAVASMCVLLLTLLTLPFWWLVQYINAMGYTPRRAWGIAYGLAGYTVVVGFLAWAVWPPKPRS